MNRLRTALIGCGAFARGMHIPNLKQNSKYEIVAAMDVVGKAAEEVAAETGATYWTTEVDRVCNDPAVDVVIISTRHDSHASLSIRAARAGKHVLCEKPMGLSVDECRHVALAVKESGVKYCVGYNRGMAPLICKARDVMAGLTRRKLIYHRIQAPFPEDLWTHDPKVGGGRFVGEGCHIFDLLCELVPAAPVMVYAAGGTFLNPDKVKIPDSGIVTITFADGSVGAMLMASEGCASFPKESTEIYCEGKAIWINDFRDMEVRGFGDARDGQSSLEKGDKGQVTEIDQLADAILEGKPCPNDIVKAARAAIISYKVHESIATGAPVSIQEGDFQF